MLTYDNKRIYIFIYEFDLIIIKKKFILLYIHQIGQTYLIHFIKMLKNIYYIKIIYST